MSTNGNFQRLWNFTGGTDGDDPVGQLVQGADGNLYGTTVYGGMTNEVEDGLGAVFQISTNGNLIQLWDFTGGIDGANPYDGLLPAGNGTFYGVVEDSGLGGDGTEWPLVKDAIIARTPFPVTVAV